MFERFSNKQLLITLGVLVALYLLTFAFDTRSERSFRKDLGLADTASVSRVVMERAGGETVSLTRSGDRWLVNDAQGNAFPANEEAVQRALGELAGLEATQLVATESSRWGDFRVGDSAAVRVKVFSGEEQGLDLVVGRFEYKQTGLMSYVRLGGEDEVYLVKGFLDASFNKAANDWRNKSLVKGNTAEWLTLTFAYPADSSFQLVKGTDNLWRLPDSTDLDNGAVTRYVNTLSNLTGVEFAETRPAGGPLMKVEVATATGEVIAVNAFPVDSAQFVLNSSQNPDAYFKGEAGNLWQRVFVGKGSFFGE